MDGSLSSEWFSKDRREMRCADGRSRLLASDGGSRLQQEWFSGREWAHGWSLSMPMLDELGEIDFETRALSREAGPGPKTKAWLEHCDLPPPTDITDIDIPNLGARITYRVIMQK